MYVEHFRLRKEPFSIAPDPRFLFMSEQHREALAHLLYGIRAGGGFVLLTGEIGAGKTTVCRCFLEQVPRGCRVAYVFNPMLTSIELLQTICQEFRVGLPPGATHSVKAHVDALNDFLLDVHARGGSAVLVVDEAQNLAPELLEQLRLLTNLETDERKLLQIILIGQPELRQMLARPELEQVAQRVIARFHLGPLDEAETRAYVKHRLMTAGGDKSPFDLQTIDRLHALTDGVPRRINLLADRALLGAYAQGQRQVDKRTLERAALEVFGRLPPKRGMRWWTAASFAGAGLVAALVWWQWPAGALGGSRVAAGSTPAPHARSQPGSVGPADGAPIAAVPDLGVGGAGVATSSAKGQSVPSDGTSASGKPDAAVAVAGATSSAATDLASLLQSAPVRSGPALSDLGAAWGVALDPSDPCAAAAASGLACLRGRGGLFMLRQIDRPALLALQRDDGVTVHARLVALDEHAALLDSGGQRWRIALPALAAAWRGDFVTLWRPPPGWRTGSDSLEGAARDWVQQRIAAAGLTDSGAPLREQVRAFQVASGLEPDGRAGPVTLMRLARAGGANDGEPRLSKGL